MTHLPEPPIGLRVVIRSVVPGERGPSGGPALTDVVGLLEAADDEVFEVRRRDGRLTRVERAYVVVVKVVPPRSGRTSPAADD